PGVVPNIMSYEPGAAAPIACSSKAAAARTTAVTSSAGLSRCHNRQPQCHRHNACHIGSHGSFLAAVQHLSSCCSSLHHLVPVASGVVTAGNGKSLNIQTYI